MGNAQAAHAAHATLQQEEERELKREMAKMEYEPMLPVEKKLITMSIGIGFVLLLVFIWASQTFFPGVGH